MGESRVFIVAIAAIAAASCAAQAADMPPRLPPPPMVAPMPMAEPVLSGWYVRGDFGYRFNQTGTIDTLLAPPVIKSRIDDAFMVGLGAGYKWNWMRGDVTFDYGLISKYKGDSVAFAPDYTTKIDTFTTMANGYFDLGTWWGFTPYLGGGLGAAYIRTFDFASATTPASPAIDGNRWNFAWAAMAGVSYCITNNFLVDIGYRYLDQGKVVTGTNTAGNQLSITDLAAHEIRAGVRWAM